MTQLVRGPKFNSSYVFLCAILQVILVNPTLSEFETVLTNLKWNKRTEEN